MLLELDRITSGYGRLPVLRDVSLNVGAGEIVALIGANGAGKSTLLNTIMGLVPLSEGTIRFDGRSIARLPTAAVVRAGIAQVPERRQLFGAMTVEENLRLGAYLCADRTTVADTMAQQFQQFVILQERRRQLAQTLSGGEQQMLAIARALVGNPAVILMDEPSEGLAPVIVEELTRAVRHLADAQGLTLVLVEQNTRLALDISPRAVVMDRGRITYDGPSDVLKRDRERLDHLIGVGRHSVA